jgi:phosphatidylserine decarboxylase
MRSLYPHQYIDRGTAQVKTERLYCDGLVNLIYSSARESAPTLFRALTSGRCSRLLGFLNYETPISARRVVEALGLDLTECLERPEELDTPRKLFERKVRFWEVRPMPDDLRSVVSPADSRMLVGSFSEQSQLFLKEKFFHFEELIGPARKAWLEAFCGGSFAVFRLTPEKYHYNHVPVSGIVRDIYEVVGAYHSCNPGAVVALATPYSKNKRVVTVIDTDVPGGTGAGLVAMVEIVALMIGDIVQCYSERRYDSPREVKRGMFLQKGQPKSLYRPGSSVDALVFQKGRVKFSEDIVTNMYHRGARSRFSLGFGRPLVETDVRVRSEIATTCPPGGCL